MGHRDEIKSGGSLSRYVAPLQGCCKEGVLYLLCTCNSGVISLSVFRLVRRAGHDGLPGYTGGVSTAVIDALVDPNRRRAGFW